jgi:hypothetical protein
VKAFFHVDRQFGLNDLLEKGAIELLGTECERFVENSKVQKRVEIDLKESLQLGRRLN